MSAGEQDNAIQQHFDRTYISSSEVCQRLGVVRSTVFNGARANKLPEPIIIRRPDGGSHIMLWLREQAEPMMAAWALEIQSRKGVPL